MKISAAPIKPRAYTASPFGSVLPRRMDGSRLERVDVYRPSPSSAGERRPRRINADDSRDAGIATAAAATPGFPLQVLLLGSPGAGESTQAEQLAELYKVEHLSVKELVADEVAANTDLGRQAAAFSDAEIPGELLFNIVDKKVASMGDDRGFVLEGFHHFSLQQTLGKFGESDRFENLEVINIEVSPEQVQERLAFSAGMSSEGAMARLHQFQSFTLEAMDPFINDGRYSVVDGDGSVEQVAHRLKECVSYLAPQPN